MSELDRKKVVGNKARKCMHGMFRSRIISGKKLTFSFSYQSYLTLYLITINSSEMTTLIVTSVLRKKVNNPVTVRIYVYRFYFTMQICKLHAS